MITRESLILHLYSEYERITKEAEAHPSMDDEELDRLFYNRRDKVEDCLMALPCQTPADFAAKVVVATARGGVLPDWERGPIWIEARNLIGGAA